MCISIGQDFNQLKTLIGIIAIFVHLTSAIDNPTCAGVPNDQFVRCSKSCNSYYLCRNGVPVSANCPPNFLFDAQTQICENPFNVDCTQCSPFGIQNIGDPSDCRKYYHCVAGSKVHRSCTTGLVFDMRIGECNFENITPCQASVWQLHQEQSEFPQYNQNPEPWVQQQAPHSQYKPSLAPWEQQQAPAIHYSPNPAPWEQHQAPPQHYNPNPAPWTQQPVQAPQHNPNPAPWAHQSSLPPQHNLNLAPWQQQSNAPPNSNSNPAPWLQSALPPQINPNPAPWEQQSSPQPQHSHDPPPWDQASPPQISQQQSWIHEPKPPPQVDLQWLHESNVQAQLSASTQSNDKIQWLNNPLVAQPGPPSSLWLEQLPTHPQSLNTGRCETFSGFSAVVGSCKKYVYCLMGKEQWELKCEGGMNFDKNTLRCSHRAAAC